MSVPPPGNLGCAAPPGPMVVTTHMRARPRSPSWGCGFGQSPLLPGRHGHGGTPAPEPRQALPSPKEPAQWDESGLFIRPVGQPRRPPTPFPPWSPQVERVHSDGAVNPGAPGPHVEMEGGTRKKAEAGGAGRRAGACQAAVGGAVPMLPSAVPTARPLGTQRPGETVGASRGLWPWPFTTGGPGAAP